MYSSLDDIESAFPLDQIQLLVDDEGTGEVVESWPEDVAYEDLTELQQRVYDPLLDAARLVDGYLRGKYVVPLAPIPREIMRACTDIAIYYLYGRRGDDVPKSITERYNNAVKLLQDAQAGRVILDAARVDAQGDPLSAGVSVLTNNRCRLFGADTLRRL